MINVFGRGYFITGIGTDVGKTYISSLLFKGLKKIINVGYYKPIQSGCFYEGENIIAPDVKKVCEFSSIDYDKNMCTYTLIPEVSPHLASEIEKKNIDMDTVYKELEIKKNKFSTLLVEGAGGVYVPVVRDKVYMFDIMKEIKFPVILVASTKVGGINHTMLTIDFLRNKGIEIQGIVFNGYTGENFENDNINIVVKDSGIERYIIVKENQTDIDIEDLEKLLGGKENAR